MKTEKMNDNELQDFVDLGNISNQVDIENARQVLKRNGYFTENLWQVADVKEDYQCTEQEAQDLLYRALTNMDVMESIWFAMKLEAENMNLKKI